jgi:Domain of unknown function (DUF4908)
MRKVQLAAVTMVLATVAACAAAPPPAPAPVHRDAAADPVEHAAPAAPAAAPGAGEVIGHRDQPPEIKLKLGHYSNPRRGIGLVFDRTTAQPKLRFDGTTKILAIDPQPAGIDRIDFVRSLGHVVLQKWGDGRIVVFVGDGEGGVEVRRDGDADPL